MAVTSLVEGSPVEVSTGLLETSPVEESSLVFETRGWVDSPEDDHSLDVSVASLRESDSSDLPASPCPTGSTLTEQPYQVAANTPAVIADCQVCLPQCPFHIIRMSGKHRRDLTRNSRVLGQLFLVWMSA